MRLSQGEKFNIYHLPKGIVREKVGKLVPRAGVIQCNQLLRLCESVPKIPTPQRSISA